MKVKRLAPISDDMKALKIIEDGRIGTELYRTKVQREFIRIFTNMSVSWAVCRPYRQLETRPSRSIFPIDSWNSLEKSL